MAPTPPLPVRASAVPARRLLLAAVFVLAASLGAIFPLLPSLQERLGFSTGGLGVLSSAAFFAAIVGQLLLARLADRGHTKALLLAGLVLAAVALLWFAASKTFAELVVARALGGLAFGVFAPAATALFATAEPDRPGANLARLSGMQTLGFTLGPAIGVSFEHVGGVRAPFLALAVVAGLLAVAVAVRCPPLPGRARTSSRQPVLALDLLKLPSVRIAAVLASMLFLPIGVYDALWARYLEDRGASTLFVGLTLSLYGVPFALAAGPAGRVVDRFGATRSALASMWVIVPLVALYGILPWPGVIVSLALFEAVANAVGMPAAQAAMAAACPPDRVAAGQGLTGAMTQATAAGVALVSAPYYGAAGSVPVFTTAAAVMAALAVLAAVALRRRHRAALPGVPAVP